MNDAVRVAEVATPDFVGVSESDTVAGTVSVLADSGSERAVVLRGEEPVGVVGPRAVFDLLAAGEDPASTAVADVMSGPPGVLPPDETAAAAAERLASADGGLLVVESQTGIEGVVTALDLVATGSVQREQIAGEGPAQEAVTAEAGGAYSDQSVCEVCGSLAPTLTELNGQLVCPDCIDV